MRAQLEKILPRSDNSFLVLPIDQPTPFAGVWHYHPEIELFLVEEGKGERFVGDDISPFSPGELVLLGANLPHFWQHQPARGEKRPWAKVIVVQFLPELFGKTLLESPEFSKIQDLLKRAERGLLFSGNGSKSCAARMQELAGMTGWKRISSLVEILGLLSDEGNSRALSSPKFSPQLDRKTNDRIGRAITYIFANAAKPITLANVAEVAGMSSWAFSRYFRKMTGRHLTKFINDVRISTACTLLRETAQDINSICFESGFGTMSNFNRLFKSEKGMTPRDYRTKTRQVSS